MKEAKLIQLLLCFTPEEHQQLKLLSESPYFNTEQPTTRLLEFVLGFAPNFDDLKMTYDHAFKYVYGKRPAVQSSPKTAISKLMSKAAALVKVYTSQLEYNKNPVNTILDQTRFFIGKQRLTFVPKLLTEAESLIERLPYRDERYFRYKLLLEFERASFSNIVQDKQNPDYFLCKQNIALDQYYAINKLQTFCFAKNEANRINLDFDFSNMEPFLNWLKAGNLLEDPGIHSWYLALNLLSIPEATHFQALKSKIHAYGAQLDPAAVRVFYSYLANTMPVIYPNRQSYYKELFTLYKEQIEMGILYIGGYLSPVMLRNITIVGIKLREFEWVSHFIHDNADKIVPSYLEREDIVALCRAYLFFAQGAYNQCLDMINILKYDNVFTKMDERRLRLMCYFELGISSPFNDLIHSFRKFLVDHQKLIPQHYVESNRLFIHYAHKIANCPLARRKTILKNLAAEIEQISLLPDKDWLLSKTDI